MNKPKPQAATGATNETVTSGYSNIGDPIQSVSYASTSPLVMSSTYSPDRSKLLAALAAAQGEMGAAGKSGDNKFDKYYYAKLEDYLEVARPIMAKHGLGITFSAEHVQQLDPRTTAKGGTEHAVRVLMTATVFHSSGQTWEIRGYGEGQDRADKAPYKAITGAKKYLMASVFLIATTDDAEADEQVGHTPPPPAPYIQRPNFGTMPAAVSEALTLTPRQRVNIALAKIKDALDPAEAEKRAQEIRAMYAQPGEPMADGKVPAYVEALEKAAALAQGRPA